MTSTVRTKGTSLAKGPVGLIGVALLAYGITAMIFGGHSFAQHAPNGTVQGSSWLGLEVNGWSGLLFITAGLLLLLAAPLHWGAKGMSLIVGLALGAVAVIALANGHGALGIFAANHGTELAWGAAAALLIVLSQLPRVGARTTTSSGGFERPRARSQVEPEPRVATPVDRELVAANGARTDAHIAAGRGTTPENRDRSAATL